MARIIEALTSTGGSIIVSDQGITRAKPAKARISSSRCADGIVRAVALPHRRLS